MLVGGSDGSGIPNVGEQMFISLIVGTQDAINSMHENTGVKKIHMTRLEENEKINVINALDFCRSDVNAWCFYVERQNIINNVFNHPRFKKKPGKKERVYVEFDKIFLKCFRHELNDFCIQHNEEIGKLSVECDSDMIQSIKRWNLKNIPQGKAFELSDAVAWCNSHNRKLKGCREVNLANEIYSKLISNMIK